MKNKKEQLENSKPIEIMVLDRVIEITDLVYNENGTIDFNWDVIDKIENESIDIPKFEDAIERRIIGAIEYFMNEEKSKEGDST